MNFYSTLVWLHIISVILLLFPSIFLPQLFHLYKTKKGQDTLQKIHTIIGIGGWTLLLSGLVMLYLQNGEMFSFLWMQFTLVLFVLIQIIDHFWADKQEEMLENGEEIDINRLKVWTIVKLFSYGVIALLMEVQPC